MSTMAMVQVQIQVMKMAFKIMNSIDKSR